MPRVFRFGWGDVLALLTIVSSALVIGWPILDWGYLVYIDNPVHLAEIHELSQRKANGWSEIGFTGFPLATLHSPLWYALLSDIARAGIDVEPIYAALLVAGFAAPSLSLYFVARLRAGPLASGLVAYLLLVQSPMIAGIGSPLAGMWTHALAASGVIVLAEMSCRPRLGRLGRFFLALVLALVALTHLFALLVAVVIIAIAAVLHRRDGAFDWSEYRWRAFGWGVAAMASAKYWLTFVLATDSEAAPSDAMTPVELACRLFLPCDAMYLLDERLDKAVKWDLHLTDAAPMVLLLAAGVFGFFWKRTRPDRLARTGFWLAAVLLVALLVHPFLELTVLGPVSWRLLFWVRIGLALSALPLLAHLIRKSDRPRLFTAAGVVGSVFAVTAGFWWRVPVEKDRPPMLEREMRAVNSLWRWLAKHADPSWGRIYVQDTFGYRWAGGGLSHSHLLALTARHVDVPLLGAYYGVVPYETRWTLSEFNQFYTVWPWHLTSLEVAMSKTNTGALVISTPPARAWIEESGEFEKLYEVSHYSVWRWKDAKNEWVAELRPANTVENVDFRLGRIAFEFSTTRSRGRLVVKTTYHPWWRMSGIPGAWLRETPDGFLGIDGADAGEYRVLLWYEPNPLPWISTFFGLIILFGWGGVIFYRELRVPEARVARASCAK